MASGKTLIFLVCVDELDKFSSKGIKKVQNLDDFGSEDLELVGAV